MTERITELEAQVEEARQWLNECVAEYEDAVQHPDLYSVDLAEEQVAEAQGEYDDLRDQLESEVAWASEFQT